MYEVYVTIMSTETTESEVPIRYSPLTFDFRFANRCFSYSNQGSGGLVRSVDKPAGRASNCLCEMDENEKPSSVISHIECLSDVTC